MNQSTDQGLEVGMEFLISHCALALPPEYPLPNRPRPPGPRRALSTYQGTG
ncbi:hypothetical protein G6O69_29500 [Pseudenhygromyxa sp. WMMC2535]|nr:hypothetical protein [Pseudenhygromyxa sp. WMMC2535]